MTHLTIITPIIHPQGDRRSALIVPLATAYYAVGDAIEALHQCTPNEQNDQRRPGHLEQADTQHRQREAHVEAVYLSLAAEILQIEAEATAPHAREDSP